MSWKKFALVAALSGTTIGAVGCGDDGGGAPMTVAYVVSTADLPGPTGDSLVGFNIDDVVSGAGGVECNEQEDWTSPSNGEGVDNQFHAVASLLAGELGEGGIPGAIEEQVAAGSFLLIMELSDVNDFMNDDSVSVHLFLGAASGDIAIGTGGRIAPDQSFTVEQEIDTVSGRIEAGRLIVSGVDLPLRLEVDAMTVELELRNASLSASISPTALSNGEIGAYLLVDDIVTVAAQFGLEVDRATIVGVVMPDIKLEAADTECNGASLGLSFSAVPAQTPATM